MAGIAEFDFSAATATRFGGSVLFEQKGSFPVLVLRGSRKTRGYDCGRLIGKRIMKLTPRFTTFVHALFGGWVPGAVAPTAQQLKVGQRAVRAFMYDSLVPEIVKLTPGVWQETIALYDGMKDAGTGIDFDDVLMFQTIPESFLHQHQCSNFAAWDKATADGKLLHAVNLDQDTFGALSESILMLVQENDEGYDVLGPSYGVGVMHASYMNSAGMSYGEMTSTSGREKWPQLPHYCQARLMAETASTLDEALAISKRTGGTTGWANLMAQTETKNDAASIELAAELVGVRRPTAARPDRIYVTNHFRGYPGLEGWEGPEMVREQFEYYAKDKRYVDGYFSRPDLKWEDVDTLEKWLKNFRCPRYELYEKKLDEWHGSIDVGKAIALQSMPPIGMADEEVPPEMPISPEFTGEYGEKMVLASRPLRSVYTCVFKGQEQTAWMAAGEQPAQKGTFFKVTLPGALEAAAVK